MSQMKILKTEELASDPYLLFKRTYYINKIGENRTWAYAERPQKNVAAVIIPLTKDRNEVILIRQYRIPLQQYVVEFPAGLMEAGEKIEVAALRELEEETGYSGKIIEVSPPTASSSGLSSEIVYLILAEIENTPKSQNLEACEDIEVLRTPVSQAKKLLLDYFAKGDLVDSKVWAFLGLSQA